MFGRRGGSRSGVMSNPARGTYVLGMSASAATSREFADSRGIGWVVREIANPTIPPKLAGLLGDERRKGGWLVFQSEAEKRRLSPYPSDWLTMSVGELEACCTRAVRVPPAPARRAPDR